MIVITGISGGVGLNIIKDVSKLDQVIGLYFNNKPKLKIKNVRFFKINLNTESEIKEFVNANLSKEKKITIIHMASIKIDKILINQKMRDVKNMFQVNFFAPFLLSKLIIPLMVKNHWGRIIFLSSTGGEQGDVGTSVYTSTKRSICGLSRVLSLEYGSFNITSNLIKLGNFDTGLYKKLTKSKQNELIKSIPSKKLGNFKNITSTIKLLINSDYINGTEINIDGGMKR